MTRSASGGVGSTMVSRGDDPRAQYLWTLTTAMNAFSRRIEEHVPGDIVIKDRSSIGYVEIKPDNPSYNHMRRRFINDVCSKTAISILQFLYTYHVITGKSWDAFYNAYNNNLSPDRMERVKFDFPKIDQTTVARIIRETSDTAIAYRLEDLSKIGLVQRSALGPPRPKYVTITDAGISVVEIAIRDGMEALKPLFDAVPQGQLSEMACERSKPKSDSVK